MADCDLITDPSPRPTRRGFLGHVAGVTFAGTTIVLTSPAASDPLADLIRDYREAASWMAAMSDDVPYDHPLALHESICLRALKEHCPPANTKAGALDALRLAHFNNVEAMGEEDVTNLIAAALDYFENSG